MDQVLSVLLGNKDLNKVKLTRNKSLSEDSEVKEWE